MSYGLQKLANQLAAKEQKNTRLANKLINQKRELALLNEKILEAKKVLATLLGYSTNNPAHTEMQLIELVHHVVQEVDTLSKSLKEVSEEYANYKATASVIEHNTIYNIYREGYSDGYEQGVLRD